MNARKPEGARNKLLARVHIAKKARGLDDDTYRAMLKESWFAQSAADLDDGALEVFAKALERDSGTAPHPRARLLRQLGGPSPEGEGQGQRAGTPAPLVEKRGYPGRPLNMDAVDSRALQLGKIEALLTYAKRPWSYADALAVRICKAERVAWVETDDLYKIIAALVKDAERKGREAAR